MTAFFIYFIISQANCQMPLCGGLGGIQGRNDKLKYKKYFLSLALYFLYFIF